MGDRVPCGQANQSAAGRRGIALPDQLFTLIMEHRKQQDRDREHAGTEWQEGGWMFTQPNGKPIDPRRDQYEWKALLAEAGVREARLHDARHTAATTLLLLGVPERAVMDVMGWSNAAMVEWYAHVTARLRRDIADRLNTYFWTANETTMRLDRLRLPMALYFRALCLLRGGGQGQDRTPTFRFSGVADVQVAEDGSDRLLRAAPERWWLPSLPSGLIRSVARRAQTI